MNAPTGQKAYWLNTYEGTIEEHLKENKETFGQELIAFDESSSQSLSKLKQYAPSQQPLLLRGESGSGKATLARALHYYRTKKEPIEYNCTVLSGSDLKQVLDEFVSHLPKSSRKARPGLLLRNIDFLNQNDLLLLEPVLNLQEDNRFGYVYLTSSSDHVTNAHKLPTSLVQAIEQLVIEVTPLRERADDVFYQLIFYLQRYSEQLNLPYEQVERKLVKQLTEYSWPGNTAELKKAVQRAMVENNPPEIKGMSLQSTITAEDESGQLSPLEVSEKAVIERYLDKNNYNKSKTARELNVAMNTLVAKIKKYKLGPRE